jgi:hypothetical protein
MAKILVNVAIFLLALCSTNASFVKRISESKYEMNVNEHGADYTQQITLDNDLVITEVPAHHDRIAMTHIFDSSNVSDFTL